VNIHCIENFFTVHDSWVTSVYPEKNSCPENFLSIEHIFHNSGFFSNGAYSEKQSCPDIFHCIEIYFIIQDFWANRACTEMLQSGGGGRLPRPPASYAYGRRPTEGSTFFSAFEHRENQVFDIAVVSECLCHLRAQYVVKSPNICSVKKILFFVHPLSAKRWPCLLFAFLAWNVIQTVLPQLKIISCNFA